MRCEQIKVPLKGAAPDAVLSTYILDNHEEVDIARKRPLILICPGGGYQFRSFRESEPVAVRMLGLGYHAAVLRYDVAPVTFPAQLLQTLGAIACVRRHAEEWNVDDNKIILMGFSAGGHLAASAGVFWSRPHYSRLLDLTPAEVRPGALVLSYPVITGGEHANRPSIDNLLGDTNRMYLDTVSLENQVNEQVPPCFIWHTGDDAVVLVENAILLASALRKSGVPFELHIFAEGPHGLSLSNQEVYGTNHSESIRPRAAKWVGLMDAWLRQL